MAAVLPRAPATGAQRKKKKKKPLSRSINYSEAAAESLKL
jgi:hypothetical protein